METAQETVMIVSPTAPGTYLTQGYFGKKAKKGKKKDKENTEWDTGFGELYEGIEERKTKKLFVTMNDLME
jgi:hypothetical protein